MNEDLDSKLRRALRPVDPGEEFTQQVMERLPGAAEAPGGARWWRSSGVPRGRASWTRIAWVPAALAASLVLVAVGLYQQRVHRQQQQQQLEEGLAARAQVLEALHVTSKKLDLAYRLVNKGT